MKKALTIVVLILLCSHAFAQDSLKIYNLSRIRITSSGMEVLGGWGILNVGTGALGRANSTNLESRYFFEMNTIWGVEDFGGSDAGSAVGGGERGSGHEEWRFESGGLRF